MDLQLRRIWAMINKVAPAMKLTPEEYKYSLGYHVLGRVDGSIKGMSSVAFKAVLSRINADASAAGVNLSQKNPTPNPSPKERGIKPTPVTHTDMQDTEAEASNRMRRKVISLAYQMRWAPPSDWQTAIKKIDEFCLGKHGKYGKTLKEHTYKELVDVVSQFEQLLKKQYSEIGKR